MAIHELTMLALPDEEVWANYMCEGEKCLWCGDYPPKGDICPRCGSDVIRIVTEKEE